MTNFRHRFRIAYYNLFSEVYDPFINLHSGDHNAALRDELAAALALEPDDAVLDLCTGTGSMLPALARQVGETGSVVGVDFSPGMLNKAREKVRGQTNIDLREADVAALPFPNDTFAGACISHAFYELKGDTPLHFLHEVYRVLKPGGRFVMMEHEVPERPFIRLLFYSRILSMGSAKTLKILRHEQDIFRTVFPTVEKTLASSGHSKLYLCTKAPAGT